MFVFPFLKPKVGLFRFSQADYSRGPAPEEEKITISVSPAGPGSWVSILPPPRLSNQSCKTDPCIDLQSSSKWPLEIVSLKHAGMLSYGCTCGLAAAPPALIETTA